MKRNFICLLLSALCNVLYLYADPALPDSVLVHQPDGTELWVYDCGDEYYNWVESTDGFVIVKNEDGIFEYATLTDPQYQQSRSNMKPLSLELWHTIYGLMRVQAVNNATERININGLPQGVYAIVLKENDNIVATDKVIIQ